MDEQDDERRIDWGRSLFGEKKEEEVMGKRASFIIAIAVSVREK